MYTIVNEPNPKPFLKMDNSLVESKDQRHLQIPVINDRHASSRRSYGLKYL